VSLFYTQGHQHTACSCTKGLSELSLLGKPVVSRTFYFMLAGGSRWWWRIPPAHSRCHGQLLWSFDWSAQHVLKEKERLIRQEAMLRQNDAGEASFTVIYQLPPQLI